MVRPYSIEERKQAVAALVAGADVAEVSTATGIGVATLGRWYAAHMLGTRTRGCGGGRKPVLDDAHMQRVRELLEANPKLTLAELASAVCEHTGVDVSPGTIGKAVKALGFHKVKLQKAASQSAPQSSPRYGPQHRREPTATTYPSTLTDAEWAVLEPLLAKKDGRGRPPTHDKRRLLDAIFYQVRTGAPWRYLPKDFPHWSAVWSLFRRLRDSGKLEQMYKALHEQWRCVSGRSEQPTAGIVDSQTVKTTEKGGPAAMTLARS
jgi:transposase